MTNPLAEVMEKAENFWQVMIAIASITFAVTVLIPWLNRMPGTNASTGERTSWMQEGFNILANLSLPTWLSFLQNPIFWGVIALVVILLWLRARSSGAVMA